MYAIALFLFTLIKNEILNKLHFCDDIDNWIETDLSGVFGIHCDYEPCQIYVEGQLLYRYDRRDELSACRIGAPGGWHYHNKILSVALTDKTDPDGHRMQVSCLEHGIFLQDVEYVIVDGLDIRYFGQSTYGKGIYLKNSSNCIFQNNKIHSSYAGIWIQLKAGNQTETARCVLIK